MRMVQKRMLLFGAYFALLHSKGTLYRKQAKSARNRSILCLQLPNGSRKISDKQEHPLFVPPEWKSHLVAHKKRTCNY